MLKKYFSLIIFFVVFILQVNSVNSQAACNPACVAPDVCINGTCQNTGFNPLTGPTNQTFNVINPLNIFNSTQAARLTTPGSIITRVLQFAFPIAGVILFVMIVWGGFEILAGANEKKSLDAGKQRVTAAIVGFLILFCSYWIAQIIEFIFGISIV